MNAEIRLARIPDAGEIANVHINAWRETYKGLIPQNYLDQLHYTFKRRKDMWLRSIEESKGRDVIVADCPSYGVIGFASVGHPRDIDMSSGELTCIYLLNKFHGKGIGFGLLKKSFAVLKEEGFTSAYCWVLENNPTISFYERTGASRLSKTKTDEIGGKKVIEIAYMWDSETVDGVGK
jgi:ribosomal protein S18 acetylase RimI-like enzyme